MKTTKIGILAFVALCMGWSVWDAGAAPKLRKLSKAEIEKNTHLIATGVITSVKVKTESELRTRTLVFRVTGVKVKNQALNQALQKGATLRFVKSCRTTKGSLGRGGYSSSRCKTVWAAWPGSLLKSKGSTVRIRLQVLRRPGGILFATVSRTQPATRVAHGTVITK